MKVYHLVFHAQMAREGLSPRRRRSLRRCPTARRAKTDRRASRLLISKEARHDNLRDWRMWKETRRGDLWERRWWTARCVCQSGLSRDGEPLSPGGLGGPWSSRLFGAQQQKSDRVTRNLVTNRWENARVRAQSELCGHWEWKRRWQIVHSTLLFLYDLFETKDTNLIGRALKCVTSSSFLLFFLFSFPPLNCDLCGFPLTVVGRGTV